MPAYTIPNFMGGVNEAVDPSLIKNTESQSAQNCEIENGILANGKGYSLYISGCPVNIKTLMTYYQGNRPTLLAAGEGSIYKYAESTWTQIATGFTNDYWDYVNDNVNDVDVIVMTNGVEPIQIYDGTTCRALKIKGASSTAAPDNVLIGGLVDIHYERLWVGDNNFLYCSSLTTNGIDIEDFTTPSAPDSEVNQHGASISTYSNDGSKNVALKVIFDDIIVFKERGSVLKIFGSSPENYQKAIIFSGTGAIADRSVVATPQGAYFLNTDGINFYDGVNIKNISQKIKKTFQKIVKDATSLGAMKNAVATFWNNKYLLAVPDVGSAANNLLIEYDVMNNSYMFRRGYTITGFAEYNKKLLLVSDGTYIFEYGAADTMNGTPISCFWETAYTDIGSPDAVKETDMLYFTASGTGSLKISMTTEKGTKSKTVTLTGSDKVYPVNMSHRGRLVKFKIENVDGSTFTFKNFKVNMELDQD